MKPFLTLTLFLFTAIVFAQNPASINGKLLDKEFDNNPLAFATVSIKGSIIETTSDIHGNFSFNNLEAGEYTLVFSFVGYQNLEYTITVTDNKTSEVSVEMKPFSPTLSNTTASSNTQANSNKVATSS